MRGGLKRREYQVKARYQVRANALLATNPRHNVRWRRRETPSSRWVLFQVLDVVILYVEYAGGRIKYGILFILSLFYAYSNLEYVRFHIIYRVLQAEYGIRIRVVASQEYVNTYSTCRVAINLEIGLTRDIDI